MKKYLGVDWGKARIGLALGDSEIKLASPYKTVSSETDILSVVLEEGIDKIIIGKPVKMTGDQKMATEFEDFVNNLTSDLVIPIELVDERLSSKMADSLEGSKKTKASRDEIAAMIILQTYLDQN